MSCMDVLHQIEGNRDAQVVDLLFVFVFVIAIAFVYAFIVKSSLLISGSKLSPLSVSVRAIVYALGSSCHYWAVPHKTHLPHRSNFNYGLDIWFA